MTYAPINISGVVLTIDGTDYSDEMISMDVSDDSLLSSTLLTTSGTIELQQSVFGSNVDNFIGNAFELGKRIDVSIKMPNGTAYPHPRGRLYVMGRQYNHESKVMTLDVGCSLAFMLTFDEENLKCVAEEFIKDFTSQSLRDKLEPNTQFTLGLLRNLLQAEGACLYQDQFGMIQKMDIADQIPWGKNLNSASYKFTVSDKHGLISIAPNNNTDAPIQTRGILEYEVFGLKDKDDNFEEYKTDSEYDANNTCAVGKCPPNKVRKPQRYDEDITENTYPLEDPRYKYQIQQFGLFFQIVTSRFIQVHDVITNEKEFKGPGRQVSFERTEEVTNKFYAVFSSYNDAYVDAYRALNPTRGVFADQGKDELGFMGTVSKVESTYKYGWGGELETKIVETYKPAFTALDPQEWAARKLTSGRIGGTTADTGKEVALQQRVTTSYEYNYKHTIEITTTEDFFKYKQNGGGVYISVSKKISGGNLANPSQQDFLPAEVDPSVCRPENQTTSQDDNKDNTRNDPYDSCNPVTPAACTVDVDKPNPKYSYSVTIGPNKSYTLTGSGITKKVDSFEKVSYPLDLRIAKSRESARPYEQLIKKYTKYEHVKRNSERYGFTIQMPLFPELFSYYPSYPFRLSLANEGLHYFMVANAITWSLSPTEAVCSIEGLMMGELTGVQNFSTPSYSPTFYPVPATVTPTTSNNTTTNQTTTTGNNIQTVTVSGGTTTTTTVPVTSLPTVTATGHRPAVALGGAIQFNVPHTFKLTNPAGGVVSPVPAPTPIVLQTNVSLTIAQSTFNFGSIGTPAGSLNFGTVLSPTNTLNAGTLLVPNI